MTTLGFLSAAWAGMARHSSAAEAVSSDKPRVIRFRFILWFLCCYLVWVSEESLVFPIEQEAAEEIEQLSLCLLLLNSLHRAARKPSRCNQGRTSYRPVRKRSLPPTATVEASVETGSPGRAPTHHGSLVHLSGHEVVVAQLLGKSQLLIGLVFFRRPHVGLVVRNVRLHVELLSFPGDQSELAWRQCLKQLLLPRRISGEQFEACRR